MTHALFIAATAVAACVMADRSTDQLRTDGVDVVLVPGIRAELLRYSSTAQDYPFKNFNATYVKQALAEPTNWTALGAVAPVKDQGPHGYCGTFGRVAAAEGQYALKSGRPLASFSEEELVDCIGWDLDQFSYFAPHGFMNTKDYPYNLTDYPDQDPPIPGNPCKFDAAKVIPGTDNNAFTFATGAAPNEDQLVAFVHHNGPTQTGIYSGVFALREKDCEKTGTCWITREMCASVKGKDIDHSVTLVGYGTDALNGDYWIVKNSWSTAFANGGYINVARGVACGEIDCCGNLFTYGDPAAYYN